MANGISENGAHSPLPWSVDAKDDGEFKCGIGGANGNAVVWTSRIYHTGIDNPADAALIVRACNSHDALVKALEKIANTFDDSWSLGSMERQTGDDARAALALAKE